MADSPFEGGLRDRLIFQSFQRRIRHYLGQLDPPRLGPMDALGGAPPFAFRTRPYKAADTIPPHAIVVTSGGLDPGTPLETGSGLSENTTEHVVTIYCEREALGKHMQGDIYSILAGKLPSIGADDDGLPVYDWREIDPDDFTYPPVADRLFRCELEDLHTDRAVDPVSGVDRDIWVVLCQVVDDR